MIKNIYFEKHLDVQKELFVQFRCSSHGCDKDVKNELMLCVNEQMQGVMCSANRFEDMLIMKVLSKPAQINIKDIHTLLEGIQVIDDRITFSPFKIYIENIIDFMSITLSSDSDTKLFRGQADAVWDLEPSITRGKNISNKEAEMYLEIQQANHKEFIENDFINNACNMQHYGIPTRLLDWTENSLHALYFACVSEGSIKENGKVYYIKSPEIININSEETEFIEHFLRYKYLHINPENIKESVLNHLKKIAFNNKRYVFFKTKYYNNRIKSQQGCFSIYYEQSIDEAIAVRECLLDELKQNDLNFSSYKGRIDTEVLKGISDSFTAFIKNGKFDSYLINQEIDFVKGKLNKENPIEKNLIEELEGWLKNISKVVEKKHRMDDIVDYDNQIQIIIKPELKELIIQQLDNIGINSRTVYPDIQGLASYLKEHY